MKPAEYRDAACRIGLLAFTSIVIAGSAIPQVAMAQTAPPQPAQTGLQGADAGASLAAAMSRLATAPRDLDALIAAGEAALLLEDPRSALGFFGRGDEISPNNGRIKAGLGRSMLQLNQIGDGLRLMEQAGNLGYSDFNLYADRGLARDLTGNQAGAQQDYTAALKTRPRDETVVRRYAVSLGIAGQLDMAEAKIQPLLYASDRAAWRDRAFILAMNGKTAEAEQITSRVMPKPLADAIKPYMERMAMLSPTQRAAAVHLGQFPPGLVNMRIASTAVPVKSADASTQASKPVRKANDRPTRSTAAASGQGELAMRPLTPSPTPSPPPAEPVRAVPRTSGSPVIPTPRPLQQQPSTTAPARAVQGPPVPEKAADVQQTLRSTPTTAQPVSRPLAQQPVPSAVARQEATPPPAPAAEPAPDRTLAQIMSEIKVPEAERRNSVAPVNLAEIAAIHAAERKAAEAAEAKARRDAARKKAEEEAKAKAAAEKKRLADNPARYWVQIGVGRDKGALAFTLRRMKREHDVLAPQDGWSASWGQTNRLVVGPFPNLARAKAVEGDLKKAGSDAFVWRSDAGEELDRIGG